MISLFSGQSTLAIQFERNANNSSLLVGSRRNSAHFAGSLLLPATFLRTPFPRFSLVDSFMLLGLYVSHTISTLLEFSSCYMMCGMKTSSAYSSNVTIPVVGSKCTTAAPSRSLTSME